MNLRNSLLFLFLLTNSLCGQTVEIGGFYDYFRGLPDGSWNGNSGAGVSLNLSEEVYDCCTVQLGGSFAVYNWDGRENLVFTSPESQELVGFLTLGVSSSFNQFNAGIVYDHLFASHFGIYDLDPSIDQLRFQCGYQFCENEIGFWGTVGLTESHRIALGVPITFAAIDQLNLFWTHYFCNFGETTLWVGAPYTNSLLYDNSTAGPFILGFAMRAPLTEYLSLEGSGSYMKARSGSQESRHYAASISIGVTYSFGKNCACSSYLPLANHSNFFVDTNITQ